jgi:anthranilate/para-aminobenzoate synthase component II
MDTNKGIDDWQSLVNKPAYTNDEKQVGIVSAIQAENLVVSNGPITPDKYLVPKASIKKFDQGIIYLNDSWEFVKEKYKFE